MWLALGKSAAFKLLLGDIYFKPGNFWFLKPCSNLALICNVDVRGICLWNLFIGFETTIL